MTTILSRTSPDRPPHLDWLEAEAIHIMREVAGQCATRCCCSPAAGLDLHAAHCRKAFRPGKFPFPLMHIDTGHNYREVVNFRDRRAAELGERLIVRSVEDSMARGTVVLKHAGESRNKHQSVTLLEAIEEFGFDCLHRRRRRDEEKARAKERIFLPRRISASGIRKTSARSCGTSTTPAASKGETSAPSRSRTGPKWTSGNTSSARQLELPSIYFAHQRPVVIRQGAIVPVNVPLSGELTNLPKPGEEIVDLQVRFPHRRRHLLHGAGRVGYR